MSRRDESFVESAYDALLWVPWWVGPVVTAMLLVVGRLVVPLLMPSPAPGPRPRPLDTGVLVRPLVSGLVYVLAGVVFLAWIAAEIMKAWRRVRFDRHEGIGSIRQLHWAEFEELMGEAFSRQGYSVEHTGNSSGDGGVDLVLRRGGEVVLVQCKQWKVYHVGVRPVRELLGVVAARRADRGIVVTSGQFTAAARREARSGSMELIDGAQLERMVAGVQARGAGGPEGGARGGTGGRGGARRPAAGTPPAIADGEGVRPAQAERVGAGAAMADAAPPVCPECGAAMVMRVARKGPQAGGRFWGCSRFPACRGRRAAG